MAAPAPGCVFCGQRLRPRTSQPGRLYCPTCDPPEPKAALAPPLQKTPPAVVPPPTLTPPAALAPPLPIKPAAPVAVGRSRAPAVQPASTLPVPRAPVNWSDRVLVGGVILGGCGLLAGVLFIAWRLWSNPAPTNPVGETKPGSALASNGRTGVDPEQGETDLVLPKFVGPPEPPEFVGPPEPTPELFRTVAVNRAIDKGVVYLKGRIQNPVAEQWGGVGATALMGLALLECDVPADDPAVQKVAAQVRNIEKVPPTAYAAYEFSVAVWFLDRLGQAEDRPLIRRLALRLIAVQTVNGGWGYPCPALGDDAQKELTELLKTKMDAAPPVPKNAELANVPALRFRAGDKVTLAPGAYDDNSNTQFVILALWAARNYGVAVERPLALVEARMRASQLDDGSWGYYPNRDAGNIWRGSMTCAGLMGLAVARGVRPKDDGSTKPERDLGVEAGVHYLGKTLGKKLGDASIPAPTGVAIPYTGRLLKSDSGGDVYFLWSVQRMAVVYDWKKIEAVDWYVWGCDLLLPAQGTDGSWTDVWGPSVDTSFALLFLKRANVVQSLTQELKSRPIEIRMKGE